MHNATVPLHDLTAVEQGAAVARGEITALDLVEHYLARIQALDARTGAFVTVNAEQARAQATVAHRAGGPLAGVPVAVKDMTATAGLATTYGSAAFADQVPTADADVVTHLRDAGLVLLGKTATAELGVSLVVDDRSGRPIGNPWQPHLSCGGSSGGSAVAVAAGLAPIAHGTDLAGSVRVPAAMCSLVGYKPARGTVSWGPGGLQHMGLGTNGVLARTVSDAAAVLDVLSRPVAGEPYPAPAPPHGGYLELARRPDRALPRRLRIGQFTEPIVTDGVVHPDCAAAVDRTADALVHAGHDVVEVKLPVDRSVGAALDVVLAALVAAVPIPAPREPLLREYTRRWRSRGATTSAVDLVQALTTLQHAAAAAAAHLAHVDLLLCPTTATPYLPVDRGCDCPDRPSMPAVRPRDREVSPYCAWFNVSGAPAVSLPVSSTADGVPVGVMLGGVALAGPDNLDARLLAVAAEVERALPWRDRHPAAWTGSGSGIGCGPTR